VHTRAALCTHAQPCALTLESDDETVIEPLQMQSVGQTVIELLESDDETVEK